MKNLVSFEAARALKEAGFPQPEFKTGQFWYNQSGFVTFIGRAEISEDGYFEYFFCTSVNTGRQDRVIPIQESSFFAPTATDILRELPETALLSRIENDFQCRIMSPDFRQRCEYARRDTNPAQACAAAYLEIKKSPQP